MSARRGSWRSGSVRLAVLGSLATGLAGCGKTEFQRNVYKDSSDCALDYSSAICASQGSDQAGRFLGPVYRMRYGRPSSCRSDDPGPGRLAMLDRSPRITVDPVIRGGFGTTCRTTGSSSSSSGTRYSWSSGS